MRPLETLDWQDFVDDYPDMRLWPQAEAGLGLKGIFAFQAQVNEMPQVTDAYEIEMIVPLGFPRDLPRVWETGGRIPVDGKHHRSYDGTLCLGAPLRSLVSLAKQPSLVGFAERCLVPYLYAMSRHLNEGIPFVFGELEHGSPGELADYAELLGLKTPEQAKKAINLLGMKERCANKHACPCGCGMRLGLCPFRFRLVELRALAPLHWFRSLSRP
ncbi:MAG: hypothetical protein V1929_08490 [bacterium]